jgi:hypothetical protein
MAQTTALSKYLSEVGISFSSLLTFVPTLWPGINAITGFPRDESPASNKTQDYVVGK